MSFATIAIALLAGIGVMRGVSAQPTEKASVARDVFAEQTKWAPPNIDWKSVKGQPEDWKGLYINMTEVSRPIMAEHHAALLAVGNFGSLGNDEVLFIPFTIGFAWQAFAVATSIAGVASAIKSCVTTDGSQGARVDCAIGIAGTIVSIGLAFQAAKGAGWFARAATTWDSSGLENIALTVFQKRELLEARQTYHEEAMFSVLARSFGQPEFLGYVEDSHRLARRDDEHLHPRAPIYRFTHPKHGLMDIASREHVNSTRFTISYANSGLEKRQSFQHERLSDHVMEARFDYQASIMDSENVQFDAAGGYDQVEQNIQCFIGSEWQGNSVLSGQGFTMVPPTISKDPTQTFGFFSLGIFDNNDNDGLLQAYSPTGQNLAVPDCSDKDHNPGGKVR